jgi:hypothetical protein
MNTHSLILANAVESVVSVTDYDSVATLVSARNFAKGKLQLIYISGR